MAAKSSAPTMKDVAQEAGVSLGTVSKVVNGIPVGKAYQKKVEAAIKKLDYKVNSYARGLKAQKTNTIAVLVPDSVTPFFGTLIQAINSSLAARHYRMLLCATEGKAENEQAHIEMAQQNQVDGIILLTYTPELEIQSGTPLVAIDRSVNSGFPCVSCDNFAGGQMAAQKLIDCGCGKLVYMGSGSPLPNETTKRRDGFISACTTGNVPYDICSTYDDQQRSFFFTYIDAHVQDGKADFDGLFCCTDYLAAQVIRYMRSKGVRVPEDVQVVGFDGIPEFFTGEYPCSTIVQPVPQIGEVCVDLVLSSDYSVIPPLVCLPVTYAYGGTTKE